MTEQMSCSREAVNSGTNDDKSVIKSGFVSVEENKEVASVKMKITLERSGVSNEKIGKCSAVVDEPPLHKRKKHRDSAHHHHSNDSTHKSKKKSKSRSLDKKPRKHHHKRKHESKMEFDDPNMSPADNDMKDIETEPRTKVEMKAELNGSVLKIKKTGVTVQKERKEHSKTKTHKHKRSHDTVVEVGLVQPESNVNTVPEEPGVDNSEQDIDAHTAVSEEEERQRAYRAEQLERYKAALSTISLGDFLVSKEDLECGDAPSIWKVDDGSLLQKYALHRRQGRCIYKPKPTYTMWHINNKDLYYVASTAKLHNRNYKDVVVNADSGEILHFKVYDPPEKKGGD